MRGKILARLPEDIGKTIRFSHDHSMTVVEDSSCEMCGKPANLVVQGETDSFGFEPLTLCTPCNDGAEQENESWKKALDVEDRAPKPGFVFMVSETTNYDTNADYFWCGNSYREAKAYYRKVEILAEPRCGLYPNRGIQEITLEELEKIRKSREEALANEVWED